MVSMASVIKTLIFSSLIYRYGILWAILITIIRSFVVKYIFRFFFNLQELDNQELAFIYSLADRRMIMTGFLILDQYKPEELKNIIIEKGIKQFDKLRRNIIQKLGNYYWNELSVEQAVKTSIKILPDMHMKNMQDILDYSCEMQNVDIPLENVQYEFHICKYAEHGMVLNIKFDHVLSDGIGFMGFLMALADNYHISMFPSIREIPFLTNLLLKICAPFYFLKYLSQALRLKVEDNSFKRNGPKGKKIVKVGKSYNFAEFTKVTKKIGITYNEAIFSIISKTAKKYFMKHGFEHVNTMNVICPFTFRSVPQTLKHHVINNDISSLSFCLPLIDNIKDDSSKIKQTLDLYVKDIFLAKGSILQVDLGSLVPEAYLKNAAEEYGRPIDMVISNVPGPRSLLLYSGAKVLSIMPTPNTGFFNTFLATITYNGEFCFSLGSDSNVKLNVDEYMQMLEHEVDNLLK